MTVILLKFWREIALILMAVAFFVVLQNRNGVIEDRDETIATLTAESKLNELQKDALRKAVTDQNDAVEAQRIDAEKRAEEYRKASQSIRTVYVDRIKEVETLKGDEECTAMKLMIEEAIE